MLSGMSYLKMRKNHKSEGLTKFVANKFSNLVQSRLKR